MFNDIQRILILAPHPDDAEFGLGGTITKLTEMGKEIHIAIFSDCEKSTPEGFQIGVIEDELMQSMEFLQIPENRVYMHRYEVRQFPQLRQEILERMIELKKQIQPDLVFLPSSSDMHQDHATVHNEGIRAFKHQSILGYEMPWNNFKFQSYMYVRLEEHHIARKIEAIKLYRSQEKRAYSSDDFVRALATIRGVQINTTFAESFEAIRLIHY